MLLIIPLTEKKIRNKKTGFIKWPGSIMKKTIKYILSVAVIAFVVYHSLYFKKLDTVKNAPAAHQFDAAAYATIFYHQKLAAQLDKAADITVLETLLQSNPGKAFADYSHALGIGNTRYFLVKATGVVEAIGENDITIAIGADSAKKEIKFTTEFVYGNAIRDASGLIDINEFSSTADFNNVSAEINKIVRKEVLPPFRASVKKGDSILLYAAMELNQAHLKPGIPELVPVALKLLP